MTEPESQLKQDLRAVRALFSGPDKWTQDALARDYNGRRCSEGSPDAVMWCLIGAAAHLINAPGRQDACISEIEKYQSTASIVMWQDSPLRTFGDVTQIIDNAIDGAL